MRGAVARKGVCVPRHLHEFGDVATEFGGGDEDALGAAIFLSRVGRNAVPRHPKPKAGEGVTGNLAKCDILDSAPQFNWTLMSIIGNGFVRQCRGRKPA